MHNVNHTTIANAVKAAFALGLYVDISRITAVPYEFGKFAEQDYRTCASALNSARLSVVMLQYVEPDTPVADAPKAGSLEANDTGVDNEREIERAEQLKRAVLTCALLERYMDSLAEQARKDTEHVGQRTTDGGRFRFHLNYGSREFKAYMPEWDEYLTDLASRATPGSQWAKKIDEARSTMFPLIDAQQAHDNAPKLFDSESVNVVAVKAWGKLIDSLALYGQAMARHEREQAAFNASSQDDAAKTLFNNQCANFRRETKDALYWATRFMEPSALLAHTGVPAYLVDSPFWRTEVAKIKAAEAEAEAAQAESKAAEAMAKVLQVNSVMKLMDANELLDAAEVELAQARARMAARRAAREQKAVEPVVEAPAKAVEPAKAAPVSLMPNVINSYGAAGFKH